MTAADIAAHASAWVDPLHAPFGDVEVYELPPPTQGVTALEALRILDGYDIPPDGVDRQHLMLEAVKLALADRDAFVTDPDAMAIDPTALLADEWVDKRRGEIDPQRAAPARAAARVPTAAPRTSARRTPTACSSASSSRTSPASDRVCT